MADGLSYEIGFIINIPPAKGQFEFNNEGMFIQSDGGILANCYRRFGDQNDVDTRSSTGLIAITHLNRSFIEGYFYFDSKGKGGEAGVNYTITNGKFLVLLNQPSNWFKPFEN